MKRKTVAVLLILAALLPGCARKPAPLPPSPQHAPIAEIAEGRELFCLADSAEEAKRIAELYGIELVEFSYGVATFHTDEPLNDVIRRGRENGWPLLERNTIKEPH